MSAPDLVVRPREQRDDDFVVTSWLKSFRESLMHGPLPPDLYWLVYRETIQRLLARPTVACLVLDNPAEDLLVGFIVHEPGWRRWSKRRKQIEEYHVVHYLYVRSASHPDLGSLRGHGFARRLIDAAGIRPTGRAFSFGTVASRGVLGADAKLMPDAARYASANGAR